MRKYTSSGKKNLKILFLSSISGGGNFWGGTSLGGGLGYDSSKAAGFIAFKRRPWNSFSWLRILLAIVLGKIGKLARFFLGLHQYKIYLNPNYKTPKRQTNQKIARCPVQKPGVQPSAFRSIFHRWVLLFLGCFFGEGRFDKFWIVATESLHTGFKNCFLQQPSRTWIFPGFNVFVILTVA